MNSAPARGVLGRAGLIRRAQRGAAMTELLVALFGVGPMLLGILQGALIFNAKTTLNYATFEAARAGSVANAQSGPMRAALARNMLSLYGGGTDNASLARSHAKAVLDLSLPPVRGLNLGSGTRVEILSPTREAFEDWGITLQGQRQIPNEHLRYRERVVGDRSGMNIQDANLLKIKVTYGYKLYVPVVNRLIAKTMELVDPANRAYYQANPPRLPIVAQATLRMQSNAYPDNNLSSPGTGSGGTLPPETGGGTLPPETGGGGGPGPGPAPTPCAEAGCTGTDPCRDGSCGNGDPTQCPTTQPASSGNALASLGVGNPIHVLTGNKYQREVDLAPLPGELGLEFVRHYNSRTRETGVLGYGWRHSYSAQVEHRGPGVYIIRQSDGRRIVFRAAAASERFTSRMTADGYVAAHASTVRWHWRSGQVLHFDAQGRLTRIVTANGLALALSYDRHDRLLQVSDPQGRRLAFSYYANGRVRALLDPAGARYSYRYDAQGNLESVTGPDGHARRYHYDDAHDAHNLTGISDGRGLRYANYGYDAHDRAVFSTHAEGVGFVGLEYHKDHTRVVRADGRRSDYYGESRHGIPLVTRVSGAACSPCGGDNLRYTYDQNLQLTAIAQADGSLTRFVYDTQGRLLQEQREAPGVAPQVLLRYVYDADSVRPKEIIRPSVAGADKARRVVLQYTATGQLSKLVETGYAPDRQGGYLPIHRTLDFDYDAHGRLTGLDGPRTDVNDRTQLSYDAFGRLSTLRTPDGRVKKVLAYDAYGRPSAVQWGEERPLELAYNERGQVSRIARGLLAVHYHYAAHGALAGVTGPDGTSLSLDHDEAGRPRALIDAEGNSQVTVLDANGNLAGRLIADKHLNVIQASAYLYDAEQRLTAVLAADGRRIEQREYDDSGRLSKKTTADGSTASFEYGPFGELVRVLNPEAGSTGIGYEHGRVSHIRDADDKTTHYRHDDFGRLVEVRSPDTGSTHYRYDAAGNVIERRDANGQALRFEYDAANRRVARISADGREQYRYQNGRLSSVTGPHTSEHYAYDDFGRLIQHQRVIDGHRFTSAYRYDAKSGKLAEKTLPDGQVLRYHYYAENGQLKAITRAQRVLWNSTVIGELQYRPFGPLRAYTHGNGVQAQFDFDLDGALTGLHIGRVLALRYQYDDSGRIIGIDRSAAPGGAGRDQFQYDAAGRLTAAQTVDGEMAFAYDKVGNRLHAQTGGEHAPLTRFHYDSGTNRLLSASADGGATQSYAYDQAGNPTTIANRRYEYNSANRPVRLYVDGRLKAEYFYNAQGERIKKIVHDGAHRSMRYYVYEHGVLQAEADERGRVTAQYLYLGYRPIAKLEGTRLYAVHTDHLGVPRAVTDEDGRTVWYADYAPFGRAQVREAKIQFALRFPGQYEDSESGTYYNWQRDYDPDTGRYLTPDPLGLHDAANMYAYVDNDPLHFVDPWGLARLTYFLIDTAQGQGAQAQGRWAFWLRDVGTGGGTGSTNVLYDAGGNFLGSASNPLNGIGIGQVTANFAMWDQRELSDFGGRSPMPAFTQHYAYDMITLNSFTVTIDDEAARVIISELQSGGDIRSKYYCVSGRPQLVFPPILFQNQILYPGGMPGAGDGPVGQRVAQGSDTIACVAALTPRRRFAIMNEATGRQESSNNCAWPCPGQIRNGTGWVGGGAANIGNPGWPASWGRTQFTTATFLNEIIGIARDPNLAQLNNQLQARVPANQRDIAVLALRDPTRTTQQQLQALGLVNAQGQNTGNLARYQQQYQNATRTRTWFYNLQTQVNGNTVPTARPYAQFTQDTGLTAADYDRMVVWWQYRQEQQGQNRPAVIAALLGQLGLPTTGLNGMTNEETLNAFQSKAIMSDPTVRTELMAILSDPNRFEVMSDLVMWRESTRFRVDYTGHNERQIAASFAFYHNSGNRRANPTITPPNASNPRGNYVYQFLQHWDRQCTLNTVAQRFALDPRTTP